MCGLQFCSSESSTYRQDGTAKEKQGSEGAQSTRILVFESGLGDPSLAQAGMAGHTDVTCREVERRRLAARGQGPFVLPRVPTEGGTCTVSD